MKTPQIGKVWRHKGNHNEYTIMDILNRSVRKERKKEFPLIVVYQSRKNEKRYGLPLDQFLIKMEPT